MFLNRNKKNNVYPCKSLFYYIEVGFKGVKIIQEYFSDRKTSCGYSLEVPHQGASNEYHNICFCMEKYKCIYHFPHLPGTVFD